ncbi:homeobox-leucine zipper protein ROC3-like isoform X1 [Asparagus officinalis]|uniref:homeobox-leucine zipper protein ROC3-like isoform X1 n=1 Tax=Asparagus officinalis TaxID=4686 RepID=UPI00098E814D|nr:homeobox-leucine zipper protein ROC3-like isoform X1 [Asparagus officinalis]
MFSSPIRNPSLGFTPTDFLIPKEEEVEMAATTGGSKEEETESCHADGTCGGEVAGEEGKRKRHHRHTARQIKEMEALFKECPHPDDKQRQRLSQDLGLTPRQVKFWFQNRRTQMKSQQDRAENVILRGENESLRSENFRLRSMMRDVRCRSCGGPAVLGEMPCGGDRHLRLENAQLKDELQHLSCIVDADPLLALSPAPLLMLPSPDPDMSIYSRHLGELQMVPVHTITKNHPKLGGPIIMDQDQGPAMELATTASEHLKRLCSIGEPLWINNNNFGGIVEVLNVEEYRKSFHWPVELKQESGEFRNEGTRDSGLVMMNSVTLVDVFLDANKWMELFSSIVSKARTLQIISSGISCHGNGSLHLMYAELQVLSPLVPTREAHFLRYCHHNAEEGTWTIVDFPIDRLHNGFDIPLPRYRRRPSGCIIQDMPNGYARVMWVEHAEIEDKPVHNVFDQLVSSGVAFGATRWLSILQRQCECHASLMVRKIPDLGVIPSADARMNFMKLSQRMVKIFCSNISSASNQSWAALSESSDDITRVKTQKNIEPGQPTGVILTAVSTAWLPFSHQQVFDLLANEQRRSQLDVLSSGSSYHEVAHIANGSYQKNCVSLLRINAPSNSSSVEPLLQESSTHDSGGSIIVYAAIDVHGVQVAMSGEDTSFIPLLPTGFVLLPAPSQISPSDENVDGSVIGCLLTVGVQVLASTVPSAKLDLSSASSISAHLRSALRQISAALGGGGSGGGARADSEPESA